MTTETKNFRLTSTSWFNAIGMIENYVRARKVNDEAFINMMHAGYPTLDEAAWDRIANREFTAMHGGGDGGEDIVTVWPAKKED